MAVSPLAGLGYTTQEAGSEASASIMATVSLALAIVFYVLAYRRHCEVLGRK